MKKFFKQFTGILAWLFLVGSVFAIVQWNGSKQELSQKSMVFTDDGTIGGDKVVWVNTGGDSIFYGPLLDGGLNPYITGWTETDPVFMANSGDYYTLNPLGYITGYTETDPVRLASSGDYIPRTAVDTGWNNTGSNTIVPSEKTVWRLFDSLTTNYIPYWSGNSFYNTPISVAGTDIQLSSGTNQIFTNPTTLKLDFRFAWSGGLMEAQYFTGGAWTTANTFTP